MRPPRDAETRGDERIARVATPTRHSDTMYTTEIGGFYTRNGVRE